VSFTGKKGESERRMGTTQSSSRGGITSPKKKGAGSYSRGKGAALHLTLPGEEKSILAGRWRRKNYNSPYPSHSTGGHEKVRLYAAQGNQVIVGSVVLKRKSHPYKSEEGAEISLVRFQGTGLGRSISLTKG